jgi:hypothetical protein
LNSFGFDVIKKYSGKSREIATFNLQGRVAHIDNDEVRGSKKTQLQFYNAFLKLKGSAFDLWIGHNKIGFGLQSYMDTHAELFQQLSMFGYGFESDWGGGIVRDFDNGDIKLAFTTGSGMPLIYRRMLKYAPDTEKGMKVDVNRNIVSKLLTLRASIGVLNYNNYNLGISFMDGRNYDVMGYHIMDFTPTEIRMVAIDFAFNYGFFENKMEFDYGEKDHEKTYAGLWRLGMNFFEENRLKLEMQYIYTYNAPLSMDKDMSDHNISTGATFRINGDWTLRTMYDWNYMTKEQKVVGQIYWYYLL